MKKKLWACLILALLFSGVGVYAEWITGTSSNWYGANYRDFHYFRYTGNVWARAGDPLGDGTYASGRIIGYPYTQCLSGMPDNVWCNDVAHFSGANDSSSTVEGITQPGAVPIGQWCYEVYFYVNHSYNIPNSYRSECHTFGWPPSEPGDGYCVSWDYTGGGSDGWECNQSPIIIPTRKSQSVVLSKDPVYFDINGDGTVEQLYWTKADSEVAFLAYDADGDGRIWSGKELFGNFTVAGQPNGFAALEALSGATGGEVASDNPFFSRLLLWTDRNHDGTSDPTELQPASDVLQAIGLGAEVFNRKDGDGNAFRLRGWARYNDRDKKNGTTKAGREFNIYDVSFVTPGAPKK